MSAPRRAQTVMSREARAMYAEIQQGVRHLFAAYVNRQHALRID
jgi:hypothetical protein